jgi:hypothetical protein
MPKKNTIVHLVNNLEPLLIKIEGRVTRVKEVWNAFEYKNNKQRVLLLIKPNIQTASETKPQDPNNIFGDLYGALHLCTEIRGFILSNLENELYAGQKGQLNTKQKLSKVTEYLDTTTPATLSRFAVYLESLVNLSTSICDLYEDMCHQAQITPQDLNDKPMIQKYTQLSQNLQQDWYEATSFFRVIGHTAEAEKVIWIKLYLLSFIFSSDKLTYEDLTATVKDFRIAAIKVTARDQERLTREPAQVNHFEKSELLFHLYSDIKQQHSKIEASLLEEEDNKSTASANTTRGRSRTKKEAKPTTKSTTSTTSSSATTPKTSTQPKDTSAASTSASTAAVPKQGTSKKPSTPPDRVEATKSTTSTATTRDPSPFVAASRQQAAIVQTKKELAANKQRLTKLHGKWVSDFDFADKQKKQTPSIEFKGVVATKDSSNQKNSKKKNSAQNKKSSLSQQDQHAQTGQAGQSAQANQTELMSTLPPLVSWELQEVSPQQVAVASGTTTASVAASQREISPSRTASATQEKGTTSCLFTPSMLVDQQGILWDTAIPAHIDVLKTIPVGVQCLWWTPDLSRFAAVYYPNCIPVCYVLDVSYHGCLVMPPLVHNTPMPANQRVFCVLAFYVQTEGETTYILDVDLFGTPIASTRREVNIGRETGLANYLAQLKEWQESVSPQDIVVVNQERVQQIVSQPLYRITEE